MSVRANESLFCERCSADGLSETIRRVTGRSDHKQRSDGDNQQLFTTGPTRGGDAAIAPYNLYKAMERKVADGTAVLLTPATVTTIKTITGTNVSVGWYSYAILLIWRLWAASSALAAAVAVTLVAAAGKNDTL